MKSFVVCHPEIKNLIEGHFEEFQLFGDILTLGLIDTGEAPYKKTEAYIDDVVLVRKKAFSVNYRDKAMILSLHDKCMRCHTSDQLIYSPFGSEFIAEVEMVGKNVQGFRRGDRVIGDNTYPRKPNNMTGGIPTNYASQRYQFFHPSALIKIPEEIPDEVAAGLSVGGQTAYAMVRKANPGKDSKVLLTSATSNTSLFILQALKDSRAEIFAITSRTDAMAHLSDMGIKTFIPNPLNNVKEFTSAASNIGEFDVVMDVFGDLYFSHLLPYLSYGARYVTCGIFYQHGATKPIANIQQLSISVIMSTLISKNISLIGNCLGEYADLTHFLSDVMNKKLRFPIDSVHKGTNMKSFMERSFNDRERLGKVIYMYDN